jgi:D-alanyl-lipoteichoic acid acyltransferase DltB (MBOAT superfamily)
VLFDSLSFAAFFPTVVVVYFLLPAVARPYFLLLASCVFYMAFVPKYILILFALITLDFFLAQIIERNVGRLRTICLWISIAGNIGMLFWFKYFNFFNANLSALAHVIHWNYSPALLSFALPLGLSFHVFQSLSYVIEVYRGKFKPEKNYFIYALYVMFFPQLVAGPIERPAHLLPQLRMTFVWDEARATIGLERMLWGFLKKLVIADNIAPIVNHIYSSGITDGPALIMALVLFSYQLYCDFSGYSDIAVGAAQVLGYEITENFDRPYASRSIAEFWRRWHISLSNWLRDYLYYPLALSGKHHSQQRLYTSLFITFVLIGLWHGANWTFVVMGALFGFYIIFGSITEAPRKAIRARIGLEKLPRLLKAWQIGCTFVLASFAWIFFRSANISQAITIMTHLGTGLPHLLSLSYIRYTLLGFPVLGAEGNKFNILAAVIGIIGLEVVQYYQTKQKTQRPWTQWSFGWRSFWRYATLFAVVIFGNFGALTFIYFQF